MRDPDALAFECPVDMKRRRVVHVGPDPAGQGGMATVISTYLQSSLSRAYDLEIVVTTKGGTVWSRLFVGSAGIARVLGLALRPNRPLFHVHTASKGSLFRKGMVLCIARCLRCRCILHLHGAAFHEWAAAGSALRRLWVRAAFSLPDAVVVLSPEWRDRVTRLSGREDSEVIPNPVYVPPVRGYESRRQTVAFLGRLGDRKGVPELLDAIRILQLSGCDYQFVLAGDGDVDSFQKQVDALPKPHLVSLPGWLDRDATMSLLSECMVFCLPSKAEGQPVALLEAMAAGTACVATPVGGIPSVLVHDVNGLLVEPSNSQDLASAIRRLATSPEDRLRLGEAARRTVLEYCETEHVVKQIASLYRRLGYPPTCEALYSS